MLRFTEVYFSGNSTLRLENVRFKEKTIALRFENIRFKKNSALRFENVKFQTNFAQPCSGEYE